MFISHLFKSEIYEIIEQEDLSEPANLKAANRLLPVLLAFLLDT